MSGEAAVAAEPEVVEAANPLSMSDEDIMNMSAPNAPLVAPEPEAAPVVAPEPETPAVPEPAVIEPKPDEKVEDPKPADPVADPAGSDKGDAEPVVAAEEPVVEEEAPNYEDFYKQVMTPFKANGKTIELKDPSEAIRLMQMGANYGRKMQELVPHRKQLTMLQTNNIDESKLSYLIDLDKKDPEAIKKLIKESGIDPLEIDTSSESAYVGGTHQVSDEEVNFRTTLDELASTPEGAGTLQVINKDWDQASKDILWKNPETMALIHDQREFGIYDRITAEIDRQKLLGDLPASTPFLKAYKTVGDQPTQAGAFADLVEKHKGTAPAEPLNPPGQVDPKLAPVPVATRVATPKPTVKDGDAASAASPTRASPTPAKVFENPLAMADDEFLKQFNGRL